MKRGRSRNNQQNRQQGRKPNPNRALESNGPGVKVRGAASTIYEKYTQLAHDATTSGDRVSAEYYYQYAEHYGRLVRTQQQEREQREADQRAAREKKQADYEARKARRAEEREQQQKQQQQAREQDQTPVDEVEKPQPATNEKPVRNRSKSPATGATAEVEEAASPETANTDDAGKAAPVVRRRTRRTRPDVQATGSDS